MSTSLLYHGFGISGYRYIRTDYREGDIVFTIMPELRFRTQQTEGSIRPDMWGFDGVNPRVFVENKFWAGLTDNQPVNYLRQLSEYTQPAVLLFVVPAEREQTLWRELIRRLEDAGISAPDKKTAAGIAQYSPTSIGPILALTSWTRLLAVLEHETSSVNSFLSSCFFK
jgi:hypothetical protein